MEEAPQSQLVSQRKVTRQKTFSMALKISELLSVSVDPWSGLAVLEVYTHGQTWPCICYLSSPSLDALLEKGNALRWLTVMVYWKLIAQEQHALSLD